MKPIHHNRFFCVEKEKRTKDQKRNRISMSLEEMSYYAPQAASSTALRCIGG